MDEQTMEISIKDILRIIRKWLALIIIVPIIVGIAATVYYYGYAKNEYTSQVKLYILMNYEDSTGMIRFDSSMSTQFAGDYKELITIPEVMDKVFEQLNIDKLPPDIKIDVSAISGTRIINVDVTGCDPVFTTEIANTVSNVFVEYIKGVTKVDSVNIAADAVVPDNPSGPSRVRNILLAVLIAVALCAGAVLAIEMLNTTVRTPEVVETSLQLPVLAKIGGYRKEMENYLKNGKSKDSSLLGEMSQLVSEDIKTLAINLHYTSTGAPLRTMAVVSTVPGEGKSSVQLMLAQYLASEGKSVLIVDMDYRNPSIGKLTGVRGKYDLIDYASGDISFFKLVVPTRISGVYIVDSCHKVVLTQQLIDSDAFKRFLNDAKETFDLMLFDTMPLGLFVDAASISAKVDGTVLIIASGRAELAHVKSVVDQLRKVNSTILGAAMTRMGNGKSGGYYHYNHYNQYHKYYKQYSGKHDADM